MRTYIDARHLLSNAFEIAEEAREEGSNQQEAHDRAANSHQKKKSEGIIAWPATKYYQTCLRSMRIKAEKLGR